MANRAGRAESGTGAGWDDRLLFDPLNELSPPVRWTVVVLGTVLSTVWCTLLLRRMLWSFALPDVGFYVAMAEGRMAEVPQPFSSRPLAPLLARWIAAAGHWPVQQGFVYLAYVSLVLSVGVVLWLALRTAAPRGVLLALVAVPFWAQSLNGLGLPDVLYAALLSGLLLALSVERVYLAALLLLPLMVARESTSLTLLCLLLVAGRRLGWRGVALAVSSTVAGAFAVRLLSAGNKGNPEHLPQAVYLMAKVPWNLVRSFGMLPWSNLYPALCATPAWQAAVHLGPLRSVGVCRWSANAPVAALDAALTTFGLLPTACFVLWRWRGRHGGNDLLCRFCLLYGFVSFLLAPALGTWFTRLFGYGWPLCLVVVPALAGHLRLGERGLGDRRRGERYLAGLLLVHGLLCALGDRFHPEIGTVVAGLLHVVGFALFWGLRGALSAEGKRPEPSPAAW